MYAIYWKCENGFTGNGQHILGMESLASWLQHLRSRYPDMLHWGQDKEGMRVNL